MISDVILRLHVLSNLELDENTLISVIFLLAKLNVPNRISEALNKLGDTLTISVLKRLCFVNLLMGAKIK